MPLEILDPGACLRLLEDVSVAWLAHCTADAEVHMVPVNFRVREDEVVFRSGYGGKLDAVAQGLPMTLGAGEFDPVTRSGWSVLVTGIPHLIGDPLVNPDPPFDEDIWPDIRQTVPVGLPLTRVTGRRLHPREDGDHGGGGPEGDRPEGDRPEGDGEVRAGR